MKRSNVLLGIVGIGIMLSGCATAIPEATAHGSDAAGFWWGLWNGWTAAFAFIGSLFDPSISVYQTPNNGGWYNFGFLVGVGAFAGAGGRAAS